MKISTQDEAFDFVFDLRNKLKDQGKEDAAKYLTFYLQGAGAAVGSERIDLTVTGLAEFLKKFPQLLDDLERQKMKQAIEAYIKANEV